MTTGSMFSTNDKCAEESTTTTFLDYVVIYYVYNYGSKEQEGANVALSWEYSFEMWNKYMNMYKICQPCKAYSLNKSNQSSQNGEGQEYLESDGEGDEEEQWGYNCYHAAGYMNCNQVSFLHQPLSLTYRNQILHFRYCISIFLSLCL